MALADLDGTVVGDDAIDDSTYRHHQLASAFGDARARKLNRLVTGLRAGEADSESLYNWRQDIDVLLRAVADAIAEPE